MNLIELREAFKSASGFSFWTSTEIDKAINSGIKFLDSITFTSVKDQRIFTTLTSGSNCISFPMSCRVIKEVWSCDDDSRYKVEKVNDLDQIRNHDLNTYWQWWKYYENPVTVTSGRPQYYNPFVTEPYEKTLDKMSFLSKFADVVFTDGNMRGIGFAPVADKDYVIEVFGKFDSPTLSDSVLNNWWSVNYPDTVVHAAIYTLDINYRNSSGVAELLGPIQMVVKRINDDAVEEELESQDNIMEG